LQCHAQGLPANAVLRRAEQQMAGDRFHVCETLLAEGLGQTVEILGADAPGAGLTNRTGPSRRQLLHVR
jgi:hypothetical protein